MSKQEFAQHLEEMQKPEEVFWAMPGEDEIASNIRKAIRMVEAISDKAAKDYAGSFSLWERCKNFMADRSG